VVPPWRHVGAWICKPHKSWEWFYERTFGDYFRHYGTSWQHYRPTGATRAAPLQRVEVMLDAPPNLWRATTQTRTCTSFVSEGSARDNFQATPSHASIMGLIESCDHHWPLLKSRFPDNGAQVATAIQAGHALGCCDGSYFPKEDPARGSTAWILEDSSAPDDHCSGVCATSGTRTEVNAYRSEFQGIHTCFLALKALCCYHQIPDGMFTLACNNERAVILSSADWLKIPQARKHANII